MSETNERRQSVIDDYLSLEIHREIQRANAKHGHARLATPDEVVMILVEELGEYAQALLQDNPEQAKKELIQVAAVAINHLRGTGPHRSSL